jgi:2-succinyl-6-hydroxy-2,4-cyclohexadiene-1-carboxylate synthase
MGDKFDHLEIALPLLKQFNLLFIDLPGHGKTSMTHFHSLEDIFSKLSQFFQIYTSKPILYGYSMGGRIALELSLHYIKPKALILESAGLGLIDKKECDERILKDQKMSLNITESNKENFLHTWYQNPIFHNYNQTDQFRKDINNKQNADHSGWAQAIEKYSPAFFPLLSSNLSELEKISFPLMYICGEKDQKYLAYANMLKSMNFKTLIINECGHNPHKTHPFEITTFTSKTLKFLS